jgi:hypothetical protein
MRRRGSTRASSRHESAATGAAATAEVLSNHALLCTVFERGAAAGLFRTGVAVSQLERVCHAWADATTACGLWRAALALRFPAAAADAAAGGAPVPGEAPAAAAARARRAWRCRSVAESSAPRTFVRPPPRESALDVLAREYHFALDVRDASGAARLSLTCHYGAARYSPIGLVCRCNLTTRLAVHSAADAACLRALAAPDGGGLRAWLTVQRRVAHWPAHGGAAAGFEATALLSGVPAHICTHTDTGGYLALSTPRSCTQCEDYTRGRAVDDHDSTLWLHHSALADAPATGDSAESDTSDSEENEDEQLERRWLRIDPSVLVLLPVAQHAGGAAGGGAARMPAVRHAQCWLGFVTSHKFSIDDTTDAETLALLRALRYTRVC